MICMLQRGKYSLLQNGENIRLLVLEKKWFIWVKTDTGIMLTMKQKRPNVGNEILQSGNYRIYRMYDERGFSDGTYVELFMGGGKRDCYHLSDGLPSKKNPKTLLQPIKSTITKTTHIFDLHER